MADFLNAAGIVDAQLQALSSGLSAKRFYRIAGQDLVLLDARPVAGLTLRYEAIAQTIAGRGGRVPQVHYADHAAGFALVEFLGDRPLSQLIDHSLDKRPWFLAATRALAALHDLEPPSTVTLPKMACQRITAEVRAFGQIASARLGDRDDSQGFLREYEDIWAEISLGFPQYELLVLADFEPENLMHVKGVNGVNIGILDFDEAFVGDQAYDLACLVESARRTTDLSIVGECIELYAKVTGNDVRALVQRVGLWSLQRHLRILGIFLDRNRPSRRRFESYIPNLVACVRRNLRLEEFAPLRCLFAEAGIQELILTPNKT